MRKLALLLLCIFGCLASANAQITRLQARDAEWKNYLVPKTNFARQINPEKNLIFRVPADWKQEESQLIFNGPHSAKLTVTIEKVPDGYPLLDYFSAILQTVKDQPGVAEATVARKTQLQDLEAREIFFEAPDTEGEMLRSTTWITVSGPLAVSFNLKVPVAHVAEVEPFFKAVVQSVIFLSPDYVRFERSRTTTIKTPAPGPIHEIESIVASLNEVNADRHSAITRLTSLFSSHADVTVDLLLDRRPLVRAAAVEALAKTNNNALIPILWELVDDKEPLVAEPAARAVANTPEVVSDVFQHSMLGFNTQTIARVWPFMAKDKRLALLQKVFAETAIRPSPPPPSKAPAKPKVIVTVGDMVPLQSGKVTTAPTAATYMEIAKDPNIQIFALTLLTSMTPEEFKLPLERVMAAKYDPLIAVALQVGNERRESLPLDPVIKLVESSDKQVSKLAARNLGFSATVADIPRIESLISKQAGDTKKDLKDELNSSVKKIRFKQELSSATTANQRREIIRKAGSDSSLANFAWSHNCESTIAGCASTSGQTLKRDFTVKPFAENLFPQKVKHYTAIPNPGQVVQKFHESLQSLQLDSARAQSNFLLTIGLLRDAVARELSAPPDSASLIEYTGIDPSAPIALGVWTAEGALDSTSSAERSAIVLRVKDRARFERAVERYQRNAGNFTELTEGAALATRLIAAWPAILPFSVQFATAEERPKPDIPRTLQRYDFIGEKDWNGLRIKTIEHHWLDGQWQISNAATYMVFIGDTVVLTPDLATLRDLLSDVNNQTDRQYLADNAQFRKAIENRGDVVYFSDLAAVMAEAAPTTKDATFKAQERGAMTIAGSSWENAHHFDFEESDWAKPLRPFHPKELSAPRQLLPASTIAYYLMSVDLSGLWSNQPKDLLISSTIEAITNAWALDFKQEVLPELGPECGGVMLELPNPETMSGGSLAFFCKLKSPKLAEALKAGKLFGGIGPTVDFAELKVEGNSYFVAARNGFLVVANNAKALEAFDGKSNLASTRDYSRAVEKVPAGIVAFGGYNLEAAVAAARKKPLEGPSAEIANLLFSLASAFHSQNFYATATAGTVSGQSSVAMDREGRYRVSDISYLPRGTNITFVTVEPAGLPITDQNRLSSLVLKVRAKSSGPIDNIKDDIKSPDQTVEQKAANELLLTVAARRGGTDKQVVLPVKDPQLEPFLKSTPEFPADNKEVKDQALQIAGNDRDAWSVARKLADWTHKNLEWKQVVRASATQTLATREADCSEFSALFVTMARSLGLPARMVSGLAYSGKSFGGHAWVEVWAGKWIELDPTWGTDFVDATHIRDTSKALVMSAALNLIEMEVVDTKRGVEDFQKSPRALAEHLIKAIPNGDRSDVEAAVDLPTLTDQFMGAGTWSKMTAEERDQMSSAYRRFMNELGGYGSALYEMRLLYIDEKEDAAEAVCLLAPVDVLLKLQFVRRNNRWYLVEVVATDTAFHIASETLQPTVATIEKTRAGHKVGPAGLSDFVRVLLLINSESPKKMSVIDNALKNKPDDKGLLLLKSIALSNTEDRKAEGSKLLRKLSDQGYVPAILRLAGELSVSEDENDKKQAIAAYERYTSLETRDPRGFSGLAQLYFDAKDAVKAKAAFQKVVELDPKDIYGYIHLISFLVIIDRIDEAKSMLVTGEKHKDADVDLFGLVMENLQILEDTKAAERFAASDPLRLKTSFEGNMTLARIYWNDKRSADALRAADIAAKLDEKAASPHVQMAMVYREQSRWTAALKAAQRAVDLDPEYAEAYYELACVLTRLGRTKQALTALSKALELGLYDPAAVAADPDLKALSSLPAFKKLLAELEK